MLTDQEMLRYIYQGAEMGSSGIDNILSYAADDAFRKALKDQQTQYQTLQQQAAVLLTQRGLELKGAGTAAKLFSRISSEAQAITDSSSSHLAEIVIRGNTMGATKIQKHLHDYHAGDAQIRALAEQEIQTAQDGIKQMNRFL